MSRTTARYSSRVSTEDRMRCSMLRLHCGHLARDGREHAIKLLDALNAPGSDRWTLVDARWTPKQPVDVSSENESDG